MTDERPPVAIGHVSYPASDVSKSTEYLVGLGMRQIVANERFAVLELRGGTHLVVSPSEGPIEPGATASFDLIVDDIEATRRDFEQRGLAPSELEVGQIHSSFKITDPSGYEITINSTHAGDRPI